MSNYIVLLLTTIILGFVTNVEAASKFIDLCKADDQVMRDLEFRLKVKGCDQISKVLSKTTSFSEIFFSNRKKGIKRKVLAAPWTDDLPHLYGLSKRITELDYLHETSSYIFGADKYLKLSYFAEFKNITDISYLPEFNYYNKSNGICKILQELPHIDTVTIEKNLLLNPSVDNCLSKLKNGVILRDKFNGWSYFKPKSKVIGIEYFIGSFKDLEEFKQLRYLGISNESDTLNGIEHIYKLSKLSHLSINISQGLVDSEKLTFLRQLDYLNITCIRDESFNTFISSPCKAEQALTDISFLRDMIWLKHLNLSFNAIKDISPILHLPDLEFLKLRGNQIESVASLSSLKKLKYLDLSGNKLTRIETLPKELYFLNLSGNTIQDFSKIFTLKNLKFLNLSNNPGTNKISLTVPSPSIKVLNLNGRTENPLAKSLINDLYNFSLAGYEKEKELLFEALNHDYTPDPVTYINCTSVPTLDENFDFSPFTNLDILTLKYNQLNSFPASLEGSNVRMLNLEANNLKSLDQGFDLNNLEELKLDRNDFTAFPDITFLPNLKSISMSLNYIKDIKNIKSLSEKKLKIDLMNNLITSVEDLLTLPKKDVFTQELHISLGNNFIKSDEQHCPIDPEYILQEDCKYFRRFIGIGDIGNQRSEDLNDISFQRRREGERCK